MDYLVDRFVDVATNSCCKALKTCRNEHAALLLKATAFSFSQFAWALGMWVGCVPLMTQNAGGAWRNFLFVMRAFASGLTLATGLLYLLSDAFNVLDSRCIPEAPWSHFPFAGFVVMAAVLFILMIDLWTGKPSGRREEEEQLPLREQTDVECASDQDENRKDSTYHTHAHPIGRSGHQLDDRVFSQCPSKIHADSNSGFVNHVDSQIHSAGTGDSSQHSHQLIRQVRLVAVLSTMVGISLGTSQSPCIIWPMIAVVTFRQFFQGLEWVACTVLRHVASWKARFVSAVFSFLSIPCGIGIGVALSSIYNKNSRSSLIVEGFFDTTSAGLLVYKSCENLLSTHYSLRKQLQSDCNARIQILYYLAVFLGAGIMPLVASNLGGLASNASSFAS